MCLSSRVAMDRSQKLINPLVPETTESACVLCFVSVFVWLWLTSPNHTTPVGKRQHILSKPPGERELRIVQEARTWCPIPLGANILERPAESLHEQISSGTNSRYSFFRDRERPQDQESLQRALLNTPTSGDWWLCTRRLILYPIVSQTDSPLIMDLCSCMY